MNSFRIKDLAQQVIVASMYVVLVFLFHFLSFDFLQFRIAEVLLILVFFRPKYAFGLLVGTFLANLSSPFGIIDALVGTAASSLAVTFMILLRKYWKVSLLFPAIFNGLIIPILIIQLELNPGMNLLDMFSSNLYWVNFGWVFLGEFIVMFALGIPLYLTINKNEVLLELIK
ncbi:MAG: QueT transporter family protein [Candidatus Phytoplasma sp.]|nr:QueT transporter family protein [Phytoplasma sp.]